MAASPSVAASPSGTASPVASPAGPDPDAGAALEAFRAFVQTDQTFHMQADVAMTVGTLTMHLDVAADVADGDEKGTIDIVGAGTSVHMEIVLVDGTAYGKFARREWQTLPADTASTNPLAGLDVEGLEPVGTVNVGGQPAHHLRTEDVGAIDTSTITGTALTGLTLDEVSFDVYVTDDGVPLTAVMEFAGEGTMAGENLPVEATIRYDFSKYGEPVVIEPPI